MARGTDPDLVALPGADLIRRGLADLRAGRDTPDAALTRMAAPRLRHLGFDLPERPAEERNAGHRLYELLAHEDGATAHGRYNALVARMSSFARSAEHARPG